MEEKRSIKMKPILFDKKNSLDSNRKRNMVFYGRVSTEHEAQLSALQNQMQWYEDQLKYHPNWNLVERYIDEGITGTQAKKRPGFLQMIEDAKKGKFDLIVTREVCRFARNTVDTLIYTRELKNKYGIEVYFVDDNIWTMDGDGELRLSLMATLAQEESRKTSGRVRAGQKVSRENGVLYGNGNILGYDLIKQDKTYVINEEQAETVKLIYDMYLNDQMGGMKIAKELTRLGRKNASGIVKWSAEGVMRILKKSTYTGIIAYGQSYSDNYLDQKRVNIHERDSYVYQKVNIPIIIPLEEWERVQKIIESRKRTVNGRMMGKKDKKEFWCKKLVCACGSSFRKNKWRTNKSTNQIAYGYQCQRQVNYGSKSFREKNGLSTEGFCGVRMVADWKLDMMAKLVLEYIWKDRGASVIKALEIIKENYQLDEPEEDKRNLKENMLKIEKLQKRLKNLIEMRADGDLSKEEFAEMKKSITDEITELEEENKASKKNIAKDALNIEEKIAIIEKTVNEYIDFSQPKIPEYVVNKFIYRVKVLDNNYFRWYIKLSHVTNEALSSEDGFNVDTCVDGRKNASEAHIIGESKDLPCVNSNTGSYRSEE